MGVKLPNANVAQINLRSEGRGVEIVTERTSYMMFCKVNKEGCVLSQPSVHLRAPLRCGSVGDRLHH